ncbi:RHS repeat domain-containing protein [Hymenobacter ginkgonis]|nr:RHS repeat domain-containing protein [Hymenobacter ginkgonis]
MSNYQENYAQVPLADTLRTQVSGASPEMNPTSIYYLLDRIVQNKVDYSPDLFSYNFSEQSGCFMQDNHGQYQTLPLRPLHISAVDSAISIVDEHGTTYLFKDKEYSFVSPRTIEQHISAWYLSRMVSADRADTIRFEYEYVRATTTPLVNQQVSIVSSMNNIADVGDIIAPPPPDDYKVEILTKAIVRAKRLKRIYFRGGELVISSLDNRLDGVGDQTLHSLAVVSSTKSDTLKNFVFYQSYFNQDKSLIPDADHYLRLRLDSLRLCATAKQDAQPPYRFTYNATELPDRIFGGRDYWGYPNGTGIAYSPNQSPWLVPAVEIQSLTFKGPYTLPTGADRRLNPAYTQAGMLTQITYPTGGSQAFDYESNTLAESYRVPKKRTELALYADEGTVGPPPFRCKTSTQILQVTKPLDYIRYHAVVHFDAQAAAASTSPAHRYLGSASIIDITDPAKQLVLASTILQGGTPSVETVEVRDSSSRTGSSLALVVGHTYRLETMECGPYTASLTISYEDAGDLYKVHNVFTGGVRLRAERLQAAPKAPVTIRRYYYAPPGSTASSGQLINPTPPVYVRSHISRVDGSGLDVYGVTKDDPVFLYHKASVVDIKYAVVSSNSLGELEGADQIVGYKTVTVVDSASTGQTQGRTVSTYSFDTDQTGGSEFITSPKVQSAWKRGNLLTQRQYRATTPGKLDLVAKMEQRYETRDTLDIVGFIAAPNVTFTNHALTTTAYLGSNGAYPATPFVYTNTHQMSGWQRVSQRQQYQYAPGDTTSFQLITTSYHYGNARHQQPTLVETTLSNGQRQQVHSRYAADYDVAQLNTTSSGPARALGELVRTHAVAQLVEQTTTRLTPKDTLVTQSQLTFSQILAPGVVVPARQLAYQASAPTPWRQFQRAELRAGQLRADARYEARLVFDRYDAQRNLTQAHLVGGTPLTYLWDYTTNEPLAKVTNAASTQVACTSFELGATGRWHFDSTTTSAYRVLGGRTGRWAYQLVPGQNQVSRANLPAATYELLLWAQGGAPVIYQNGTLVPAASQHFVAARPDGWKQYRTLLVLTQSFGGNAVNLLAPTGSSLLLDEVRLAPVQAQLTSYTYDGLRGMTSQTDPTGRTVTYEYDGLGRLVRTRDEQGRILSQQQYHYAGK